MSNECTMADHPSKPRRFDWYAPVVAPFLADRRVAIAFGLTGVVQTALGVARWKGIPCPILHALGIPCPGCGVSRACAAFVVGDWHEWLRWHLFAPLFLILILLLLAAGFLPTSWRSSLVVWVRTVERKTALAKMLMILLVVYWLTRLAYAPLDFAHLMKS